jgi:hypothetical protein
VHAAALWTRTFALRRAEAPDTQVAFCPELLPHVAGDAWFGYAPVRRSADGLEETTDRFAEALRLFDLADACAASALHPVNEPRP